MSGSLDYSNADVVDRLVSLYDHSFGGKPRGRYRISMKLMCRIVNQRRLWPEQVEAIRRGLYETGHILIDLGTYFVVVNQQTFSSYRRLNEASIATLEDALAAEISTEIEEDTPSKSEDQGQVASSG
ncbi:hypothetical protein [Sneathiella litorea]|uniref:Uncharacterized protein n=1 Tax=Sneathiella litorea TaxID=2606216 RepID=A0A6L8W6G8_9PROT|nr:hypothetical protein [Sneathiella litorea]MZR30658.1 hypothetical protein [Sneathiella litorea]